MERDKEKTKQKLIDAVGRIVVKDGFSALGINAVAKEAGCDKVLIYRYFSDLDGLVQAFVDQKDYFGNLAANVGDIVSLEKREDVVEASKKLYREQLTDALSNKELQEILLWELLNKNEITIATAEKREKQGQVILKKVEKALTGNDVDIPAVSALLLGGIYYLVLRSRGVPVFNGIDLTSEDGWKRIDNAVEQMIDLIADK